MSFADDVIYIGLIRPIEEQSSQEIRAYEYFLQFVRNFSKDYGKTKTRITANHATSFL